MGDGLRRSAGESSGSLEQPIDEWSFLDQQVRVKSPSPKVCMTCHWFRHHSGVNCIPLLTCHLHQGLLAQGKHLVNRCQGWTDAMALPRRPILLPCRLKADMELCTEGFMSRKEWRCRCDGRQTTMLFNWQVLNRARSPMFRLKTPPPPSKISHRCRP